MIRDNREDALAMDASLDDQQLLQAVLTFYQQRLKEHAPAQEYMRKCSLADVELIDQYGLGFADRSLTKLLPSKQLKAGRQIRERLTRLGILRESGHGHFNGCVVIPIRDSQGAIIDIRGRKITKGLRKGTPLDMQLPTAPGDTPIDDETVAKIVGQLQGQQPVTGDYNAANAPQVQESVDVERTDTEVTIQLDDRRWRIRGLEKQLSYDRLKVNLMVARKVADPSSIGDAVHVDTFDLYSSRHRAAFVKQAAQELYVEESDIKADLGKVLFHLEELQEQHIKATLAPKDEQPTMSEADKDAALALLKDPNLLDRVVEDFDRCGVVGEVTNKLVGYIAASSRKLNRPLAVMIQSSSGTGKTTLMDAVLAMMPPEDQQQYTAMTGQSLFYMDNVNLKHKILALAEEEGTQQASYALKLLQSEAKLRIVTTGKATATGRNEAQVYEVEGPVGVFVTTTSATPDEELTNRCIVLAVDESAGQTRAIHQQQRAGETLDGALARRQRDAVVQLHQNAQRLLRPLLVVNPLAKRLTFGDHRIRSRRDHMKYLTLIRAIALLHQYQREVKTITRDGRTIEYIEATRQDVETANRLADEVLGCDVDELPPQTRKLWTLVDALVSERSAALHIDRCACRFSRRDLRLFAGWSQTQIRVHLDRLVDMEYVMVHQGGRGKTFVYELLFDASGGVEVTGISGLDDNLAGSRANLAGSWRGQSAPLAGTWRPDNSGASAGGTKDNGSSTERASGNGHKTPS